MMNANAQLESAKTLHGSVLSWRDYAGSMNPEGTAVATTPVQPRFIQAHPARTPEVAIR